MAKKPKGEGPGTAEFFFEVGGIQMTMTVFVDDVPKILAWSNSEVLLYLGSNGPLLQSALRDLFGS